MITILSDFGNSEYLGVMKGAIFTVSNDARIVDLCNEVNPHQMIEGAWILLNSYRYFPKGTIFLCVVDPGVGSKRKCIAIRTKNYFFVGPDNGLMFPAANEDGIVESIELSSEKASNTFHGRDVFARAAALIDLKMPFSSIGKMAMIKSKFKFHLNKDEGQIVRIDIFGNIITNIPHSGAKAYGVILKNKKCQMDFYATYNDAPTNVLFLILGSSNTLEISLKNSSAALELMAKSGEKITIRQK